MLDWGNSSDEGRLWRNWLANEIGVRLLPTFKCLAV
jgi:hypothetical protein